MYIYTETYNYIVLIEYRADKKGVYIMIGRNIVW